MICIFLFCIVQVNKARGKSDEMVTWLKSLEETYERASRPRDQLTSMIQRVTLQQQLQQEGVDEALTQCCQMVQTVRQQGSLSGKITITCTYTCIFFFNFCHLRLHSISSLEVLMLFQINTCFCSATCRYFLSSSSSLS